MYNSHIVCEIIEKGNELVFIKVEQYPNANTAMESIKMLKKMNPDKMYNITSIF